MIHHDQLISSTLGDAGASAGGAMAVRRSSVALRRPFDPDDTRLLQQRFWLVLSLRQRLLRA